MRNVMKLGKMKLVWHGVIIAPAQFGTLRKCSIIITMVSHGALERVLVLLNSLTNSVSRRVNEYLETLDPDFVVHERAKLPRLLSS